MAIPHEVVTEARRYQVVRDVWQKFHVLAWGRVAGVPARSAVVSVSTPLPYAVGRSFDDGFWCVAGDPSRSFDDLTVANTFGIELSVTGYRDVSVTVNVPPNPVWPMSAGTQRPRPLPVRVQGRVTAKLTGAPVAVGVVQAVDPPVGPPPAARPFVLRSLLRQDHTATAQIQGVTLTPVALAPARELAADAWAGATEVTVNNRAGLAPGQVIRFHDAAPGEYGRISSVIPLAAPGIVTLETALQKGFHRTIGLQFFTAGGAIGPLRNVLAPALRTEGLLQIDDVPQGDLLVLTDAGLFDEFHGRGALTDAQGYFALDGISPVDRLWLGVAAAGFASPPEPNLWIVDYGQTVNIFDFRLT